MLSGGPASAGLAALVQSVGERRVPTCAVAGGPAAGAALAAARRVARELGTDHHERELVPADVADAIPLLAAAFDQPCGDPQAVVLYHGALAAREAGVRKLLCGHGAAVLFGRRAAYAHQLRLSRYEQLPSGLRQLLLEPLLFRLAAGVRRGPLAAARAHVLQSMRPLPARLQLASLLQGYGPSNVFDPEFFAAIDSTAPAAAQEQAWWLAQARDQVNRMIALDMQYALADHALPMLARASCLAGVDSAAPYLQDGVVAFAARLDPRHKRGGDARGALLRSALGGPAPARTHPEGLALPFGQWLQTDARLKGLAFDSLADLRKRRIVRGDFVDTLLARQLPAQPARHGTMVWMLMMLEQWFAQRRVDCDSVGTARARAMARAG
jgi:asparagine synthase (glutamine-hydrolysing)